MTKLGLALFLALGLAPAQAQQVITMPPPAGIIIGGLQVVQTCGTASLTAGQVAVAVMDHTGVLCSSASGGGGGGLSVTDQTTWIQGTSAFTPTGCVFNDTATLSSGQEGTLRCTTDRQAKVLDSAVLAAIQASVPAGTNRIGYASDDPCSQKIKTTAPFSTTSGGPVSIVALSGSTVVYVCSISAITDTAIKLSFIDGTGGSCAAAQHAIWGSTTAASGMSLPATGGFTMGSGNGTVGQTTAASAFCLLQSGTSLVAGNISYVQQ